MQKYNLKLPLFSLFLGAIFLSFSSGYANSSSQEAPRTSRPGISGDTHESSSSQSQTTRQKRIAYMNERDRDIHHRANRRGEWGYKQNYRYDREAFYKGETQGEAYDLENPDSAGGIGMDPDVEYLEMRKFYLEEEKRNRQISESSKQASKQSGKSSKQASKQNGDSSKQASKQNGDDSKQEEDEDCEPSTTHRSNKTNQSRNNCDNGNGHYQDYYYQNNYPRSRY